MFTTVLTKKICLFFVFSFVSLIRCESRNSPLTVHSSPCHQMSQEFMSSGSKPREAASAGFFAKVTCCQLSSDPFCHFEIQLATNVDQCLGYRDNQQRAVVESVHPCMESIVKFNCCRDFKIHFNNRKPSKAAHSSNLGKLNVFRRATTNSPAINEECRLLYESTAAWYTKAAYAFAEASLKPGNCILSEKPLIKENLLNFICWGSVVSNPS